MNYYVPCESSLLATPPQYHLLPSLLNVLAVSNLKEAVNHTGTKKRVCKTWV